MATICIAEIKKLRELTLKRDEDDSISHEEDTSVDEFQLDSSVNTSENTISLNICVDEEQATKHGVNFPETM